MPFSYTSQSSGWLTAIAWVNFYPTFLGAGIRVMHRESDDYRITVRMKLTRFNLNRRRERRIRRTGSVPSSARTGRYLFDTCRIKKG